MRSNDRASHGPRARRLGASIPAAGCKCQANAVGPRATPRSQRLCGLWLGSPQPGGLKPFVDFCLAVSRRVDVTSLPGSCGTLRGAIASLSSAHPPGCLVRPTDCFAGYDAAPAATCCPALAPSTKPLGRGAEKHAKGMIPHPDGGRHRFSGEKCRSKISKCSSAALMGFNQRFPRSFAPRSIGNLLTRDVLEELRVRRIPTDEEE